jgi:hypothetical protein
MFRNRLGRTTLVVALIGFAWLMLSSWSADNARVRLASAMMAAFAVLLALGIAAPHRARWALRLGAGMIGVSYLIYFLVEVWRLLGGERQELRPGQPSATMAGLGVLVYAIPMIVFAISGYPGDRWRSVRDFLRDRRAGDDHDPAGNVR